MVETERSLGFASHSGELSQPPVSENTEEREDAQQAHMNMWTRHTHVYLTHTLFTCGHVKLVHRTGTVGTTLRSQN